MSALSKTSVTTLVHQANKAASRTGPELAEGYVIAGDLADTLAAFASRYGLAVLALWVGLRGRRRAGAAGAGLPAASPAEAAEPSQTSR
jgi:hypothetical protein